jgi:hypothetical protein
MFTQEKVEEISRILEKYRLGKRDVMYCHSCGNEYDITKDTVLIDAVNKKVNCLSCKEPLKTAPLVYCNINTCQGWYQGKCLRPKGRMSLNCLIGKA